VSKLIFGAVFLAVLALLNLYIVKRFVNKLHIKDVYKKYFKLFLVVNYIGVIGYIYTRYNPEIPNWLFFLLSLPIGVIFLLFCLTIIYDLLRLVIEKIPMNQQRREFFKKGFDYFTVALSLGVLSRAIYEAKFIEIEKVDIKLKNLKRKYSIVQISDVHIGGIINQKFIKNLVEKINTLSPDIVVITGDLVDISLKYAEASLNEFKNLKTEYGTYFVAGNHEYFHGVDEIISFVDSLGIKTLENENLYIGDSENGFNLAGLYDYIGYRVEHHKPDLAKALKSRDETSPTILLAHQPVLIEEIKESDSVDLVLSGHTHGGQLYPFRLLVSIVQPYIAGLYQHSKKTQIYVNRGTGFWGPPMRLGVSSEITHITIS